MQCNAWAEMGTSTVRICRITGTGTNQTLSRMIDYPTGRILRDARLYTVGAGTQEIRRMLIGREFNEEFKRRAS